MLSVDRTILANMSPQLCDSTFHGGLREVSVGFRAVAYVILFG